MIVKVKDTDVQKRLDIYVSELLSCTRSNAKLHIDAGDVLLNGKIVKAGAIIKLNDEISIEIPEPKPNDVVPEDIDIDIVYQDKDLAVINKPQGMVVHPACGNQNGTLVNALLFKLDNLSGINGVIRPGIVHRLDKDTSGLLLIAKNDASHVDLAKQIEKKICKRKYLAVVCGNIKNDEGHIETYIGRDKKDRKKMAVQTDNSGKLAITNYKVLERFGRYTLVEFELKTGRTHQIRVHAKYIGNPVVGDETYGNKSKEFNLNGQLLHAYEITFIHPTTKEIMTFNAPLPKYFENVLNKLKNSLK